MVVLGNDLERVGAAIETARRTFRVIRQNLAWASGLQRCCDSTCSSRIRYRRLPRVWACRSRPSSSSATRCGSARPDDAPRANLGMPSRAAAGFLRHAVDILYLLIPLSVVLALLIGVGDLVVGRERTVRRSRRACAPHPHGRRLTPFDLRQCRSRAPPLAFALPGSRHCVPRPYSIEVQEQDL